MTQVRHAIDPEPVRAELKNAAVLFLLDQWQPQRVAIKGNRLLVRMARALDRDVRSARKLRPFEFSNHRSNYSPPVPSGSVILIGSSARSSSSSGKIFFSRAISRTVLPVLALSLAISAARS